MGGAPRVGDAAQWQERIEDGLARLQTSAIDGISSDTGVRLPKGGFAQLSDGEVNAAVEYMIEVSK